MTDEFDDLTPVKAKAKPRRKAAASRELQDNVIVSDAPQAALTAHDERVPSSMLEMVHRAIHNPAIDPLKMREMLGMLEQVELRDARAEFERAMFDVSSRIGQVAKNGRIPLKNKDDSISYVKFGTFNDMDAALRPLLSENNLRASFTVEAREGGGGVIVGRVTHINGQFATSEIPLPLDTGPGRNNLQAMGSTYSYGKRYALAGLLNIVFYAEDDDGEQYGANLIEADQIGQIQALLTAHRINEESFCQRMGLTGGLASMRESEFRGAMASIKARVKELEKPRAQGRRQ